MQEEPRRRRKNVTPDTRIRMLSIREIARRYDFHPNTIRNWIHEENLRYIRYGPGGKIFIAEKDVEAFIQRFYSWED